MAPCFAVATIAFGVAVLERRALLGVPSDAYPNWTDLKRFTLDRAVEEVNHLSHFTVMAGERRYGRRVIEVTLAFEPKSPDAMDARACSSGGKRSETSPQACRHATLDRAQEVISAAMAEANRHDWKLNVGVVDSGGNLVAFARMDGAQLASIAVSEHKARTAASFRRETKAFESAIQGGNTYVLSIDGVVGSRGGIPLIENGKLIGAIGVSGGTGSQDEVCAKAGAAPIKQGSSANSGTLSGLLPANPLVQLWKSSDQLRGETSWIVIELRKVSSS